MAAWLLGVFVLVLLAGLALIRLGWRGRRINRDPVCRDCGFNLHAFRLPDMHGVPAPHPAAPHATPSEPSEAGAPHSLALGAPQGSETPIAAATSPAAIPITVTCPECGGGLKRPKALRIGERKRMPLVVALGVFTLALAALPLGVGVFVAASGQDYSKHLPVNVLLFQSNHAGRETNRLIAIELERRLLAKALDSKQIDLVVERALELQADWSTPWIEEWGSVYEAAALANGVSAAQSDRWFAHAAKIQLIPRSKLRAGDPLPVRPVLLEARTSASARYFAQISLKSATINGKNVKANTGLFSVLRRQSVDFGGTIQISGTKASRSFGGQVSQSIGAITVPKDLPPGKHELIVSLNLNRWDGTKMNKGSTPQLRCEIEVVADASPAVTLIPSSQQLDEALRAAMQNRGVIWRAQTMPSMVNGKRQRATVPSGWYLEMSDGNGMPALDLPVPIHMVVYVLDAEGVEHEMGLLTSEPWSFEDGFGGISAMQRLFNHVDEPIEAPFTIILRPDREAAKATFTLTSIYNGEIRIPVEKARYSDVERTGHYKTKQELLDAMK